MWQHINQIRKEHRRRQLQEEEAILAANLQRECIPAVTLDKQFPESSRASVVLNLLTTSKSPDISALAVFLLDRLISVAGSQLPSLQNLGCICLRLATKLHGIEADSMSLPYSGIVHPDSEFLVLDTLGWNIVFPTSFTFLHIFCDKFWIPSDGCRSAAQTLAQMLVFGDSRTFRPSTLALIAILLLTHEDLLPDFCLKLTMQMVRVDQERTRQVIEGVKAFTRLLFNDFRRDEANLVPDSKCTQTESDIELLLSETDTTAYPDSDMTDDTSDFG